MKNLKYIWRGCKLQSIVFQKKKPCLIPRAAVFRTMFYSRNYIIIERIITLFTTIAITMMTDIKVMYIQVIDTLEIFPVVISIDVREPQVHLIITTVPYIKMYQRKITVKDTVLMCMMKIFPMILLIIIIKPCRMMFIITIM